MRRLNNSNMAFSIMFRWRFGPFWANSAGFGDGKNFPDIAVIIADQNDLKKILLILCISLKFALKCLIFYWESSKCPPFFIFKMADSHHRIGYHNKYCTKKKFSDLWNTIELSESINRCIIFKILACLCYTMDESMDISA